MAEQKVVLIREKDRVIKILNCVVNCLGRSDCDMRHDNCIDDLRDCADVLERVGGDEK